MHYGEIKNYDIANGIGVRVSLFVWDAPTIANIVFSRKPGISPMENPLQKKRRKNFCR